MAKGKVATNRTYVSKHRSMILAAYVNSSVWMLDAHMFTAEFTPPKLLLEKVRTKKHTMETKETMSRVLWFFVTLRFGNILSQQAWSQATIIALP